jgi:hypothetical protein
MYRSQSQMFNEERQMPVVAKSSRLRLEFGLLERERAIGMSRPRQWLVSFGSAGTHARPEIYE